MSITEDNKRQLNRFKNNPPHPSYIAGFIDGDGCIFIRKIIDGYQVEIPDNWLRDGNIWETRKENKGVLVRFGIRSEQRSGLGLRVYTLPVCLDVRKARILGLILVKSLRSGPS